MKHIKGINELFGLDLSENDIFANRILDIVSVEKIEIEKEKHSINKSYIFIIDNIKYKFYIEDGAFFNEYYLEYKKKNAVDHCLKISKGVYKRMERLYKEYIKYDLPDVSDLSRTAKKYNL